MFLFYFINCFIYSIAELCQGKIPFLLKNDPVPYKLTTGFFSYVWIVGVFVSGLYNMYEYYHLFYSLHISIRLNLYTAVVLYHAVRVSYAFITSLWCIFARYLLSAGVCFDVLGCVCVCLMRVYVGIFGVVDPFHPTHGVTEGSQIWLATAAGATLYTPSTHSTFIAA